MPEAAGRTPCSPHNNETSKQKEETIYADFLHTLPVLTSCNLRRNFNLHGSKLFNTQAYFHLIQYFSRRSSCIFVAFFIFLSLAYTSKNKNKPLISINIPIKGSQLQKSNKVFLITSQKHLQYKVVPG